MRKSETREALAPLLTLRGFGSRLTEGGKYLFRELFHHHLISIFQQWLQFAIRQCIKAFEAYPVMTSHVRSGNDAIQLHQLRKLLRRTLKGECHSMTRFKSNYRKHLFTNAKQEIVAPLDFFIDVGKRETIAAN
jgi:hypothetical protein